MLWLAWRQFRAQTVLAVSATAIALALLVQQAEIPAHLLEDLLRLRDELAPLLRGRRANACTSWRSSSKLPATRKENCASLPGSLKACSMARSFTGRPSTSCSSSR